MCVSGHPGSLESGDATVRMPLWRRFYSLSLSSARTGSEARCGPEVAVYLNCLYVNRGIMSCCELCLKNFQALKCMPGLLAWEAVGGRCVDECRRLRSRREMPCVTDAEYGTRWIEPVASGLGTRDRSGVVISDSVVVRAVCSMGGRAVRSESEALMVCTGLHTRSGGAGCSFSGSDYACLTAGYHCSLDRPSTTAHSFHNSIGDNVPRQKTAVVVCARPGGTIPYGGEKRPGV